MCQQQRQQRQQQQCYKHAASSLYSFDRILVNEVSIAFTLLFEHCKFIMRVGVEKLKIG